MNSYEILPTPESIISFFMSVPDEVFFLRIGVIDAKEGTIKPYKALLALEKISEVLGKDQIQNPLSTSLIVNRTNEIIQRASIKIIPKDDYTLLCIRHVDKPIRKEEKENTTNDEMPEKGKQSSLNQEQNENKSKTKQDFKKKKEKSVTSNKSLAKNKKSN